MNSEVLESFSRCKQVNDFFGGNYQFCNNWSSQVKIIFESSHNIINFQEKMGYNIDSVFSCTQFNLEWKQSLLQKSQT